MTTQVLIVVHSRSGGSLALARAIAAGAEQAEGVEVRLARVPEFVPDGDIEADPRFGALFAQHVAPLPVVGLDDVRGCDALVVGGGTRFGSAAAELRRFLEQLSPLWFSGELVGRVGAAFATASSPHGGQVLAVQNTLAALMHLGLVIVTPGYAEPACHDGGSPYGAVARAGGPQRHLPSDTDLAAAAVLGRRVAAVATPLARERELAPAGAR
jgi:NAD(P)H dehydrogenase (quinone)